MKPKTAVIGCFGKVPASSDFIRADNNPPVIAMLDAWLAQAMNLLSSHSRWKIHYDTLGSVNFAFIGISRRHAIVGRIDPSRDQAGRRFPLLLMSVLDVEAGNLFLALSPIILEPAWRQFDSISLELRHGDDYLAALENTRKTPLVALRDTADAQAALAEFTKQCTLDTLERSLLQAGHVCKVRNLILIIGVLMRPLSGSSIDGLESGLRLPLPAVPLERAVAASFYMGLISVFLTGCDMELSLFLPQDRHELIVGFSGASPHGLHALVDPQAAEETLINCASGDWIDAEIAANTRLHHLACILEHANLPLASAQHHFLNTFRE